MSYEDHEVAVHNGKPIELYEFVGPLLSYLYTSAEVDWQHGENFYTSVPIKLGSIKVGTQEDDKLELTVDISIDTDLVRHYAFQIAPPSLFLNIYRIHRGDGELITYFSGPVGPVKVSGLVASFQTPSILSHALNGSLPSVWYQTPCNNDLFGPECGLNRENYRFETQVFTVNGRELWLLDDPGVAENYYAAGEVVFMESGERRMIVGNVGQQVFIAYPFSSLPVGVFVELVAGCDHDWDGDCKTKFNNQKRSNSFRWVPVENPFTAGLD